MKDKEYFAAAAQAVAEQLAERERQRVGLASRMGLIHEAERAAEAWAAR